MERVQYQLERSIPQLRLLEENGVFKKEELRSVVAQRQAFESRLLRRGPDITDYLRYIELEQNLDRLINAKAQRLGLPRAFHHANSASHTGHIISIFERMVQKFKHDTTAWGAYISYAHSKKMRLVAGRVTARALALHSNNIDLWIDAANHELNDNSSTTAARSLLQRALRLNELPWRNANPTSRKSTHGLDESSSPVQAASGPVRLRLSQREKSIIRLWVQYIKMELVFIERLRRRWLVLGLQWDENQEQTANPTATNDSTEAAQAAADIDASASQHDSSNQDDTEQTILSQVPEAEQVSQQASSAVEAIPPRTLTTIPPSQLSILRGNIPLFLVSSALQSLAPSLHFAFLVSLTPMFRNFPFAEPTDLKAYHSGQALRSRLLQSVYSVLRDQQRWTWDHFTSVALFASTQLFLDTPDAHSDSERKAAQIANQEELSSHKAFLQASQLSRYGLEDLGHLSAWLNVEKEQQTASVHYTNLLILQSLNLNLVKPHTDRPTPLSVRLANSGALPNIVRNAVESLRSLCKQAPIQSSTSKTQPKSELYTATDLLLEFLASPSKSAINEPNLLSYLNAVKSQLLTEARAAGPGVESAHMRARTLRKSYEAAVKTQSEPSKLANVVQDLTEATAKTSFPDSDELWLLRIQAKTRLYSLTDPDVIANEWQQGLITCSETVNFHTSPITGNLWRYYCDWLNSRLPSPKKATGKGKKAPSTSSFDQIATQYQWAVRQTGSLLSRTGSGLDVEQVHEYRQENHNLTAARYVDIALLHGKETEACSWLLHHCFITPMTWVSITDVIVMKTEKNQVSRKRVDLADVIWAKVLQSEAELKKTPNLRSLYLQHLAFHNMPKALTELQRFETTLSEPDFAYVQSQWQKIINLVEELGPAEIV